MRWNDRDWVAKKVVTLGPDQPEPTRDRLEEETTNSLILLKLLDCFFKKFVKFVKKAGQSSSISGQQAVF
jgi:predicted glycosyltransferase